MMFFLAAECREQSLNEHSRERPETAKLRGPYRTSRVCSIITPTHTAYMRFADYQDKTKSLQLAFSAELRQLSSRNNADGQHNVIYTHKPAIRSPVTTLCRFQCGVATVYALERVLSNFARVCSAPQIPRKIKYTTLAVMQQACVLRSHHRHHYHHYCVLLLILILY